MPFRQMRYDTTPPFRHADTIRMPSHDYFSLSLSMRRFSAMMLSCRDRSRRAFYVVSPLRCNVA